MVQLKMGEENRIDPVSMVKYYATGAQYENDMLFAMRLCVCPMLCQQIDDVNNRAHFFCPDRLLLFFFVH